MKRNSVRAATEIGFILFLFYANLLMGQFEGSGMGQKRGLLWAVKDVVTASNFGIGAIAAVIGFLLFESLRKRL